MEQIVWDQASFGVGVAKLDEQHKRIIDATNLLLRDPELSVRSESVSEVLGRLVKYAQEHFKAEEGFLAQHGSPDLAEQKKAHRGYLKAVVGFCSDATAHREAVPQELLGFLRNWWVNHIQKDDMKYRPFLAERGVR
ncbi:MAG: hemerythrin family protein [Planctomycetes bacterium]|nr:hemerythrin family protein [Planctomycetota bacterium]